MIGLVLCGGQSSRMGVDKGLLSSNGKTWAEIAKENFSLISIPWIVSINSAQKKNYLLKFKEEDLVIDQATLEVQGPLLGLLSAHQLYPEQDIMMLACDMINMKPVVLEKLLNEYKSSGSDALVYSGERVEPMCAVYSSVGLKKIMDIYKEAKPNSYSMMSVLEMLNVKYLSIPEDWKPFFKNYNSPSDLI